MKFLLLIITLLIGFMPSNAKPLILSEKELSIPPPRIIRTCCSFGADVKMMGIPGVKFTEVVGIANLGQHTYLGSKKSGEGNGIIYTKNGGFIDMGHLRDQADWTAYLYALITSNKELGRFSKNLGFEGGQKTLTVSTPDGFLETDIRQLAGRIAYDLSVWHEIATWYGASYIPLVPERFSSFSLEDAYSNLLGVHLGMKAIASPLPFEEAMTQLILETLNDLEALDTEVESILAMEAVRDIWWTRAKKLPSKKVLLKRQLSVYPTVKPLLIEAQENSMAADFVLPVPQKTQGQLTLSNFYELSFKLNQKVPFRKLFPQRKKRLITQKDFPYLLERIGQDIWELEQKQLALAERKLARMQRKKNF